jgi:hypothetical protein
MKRAAGVSIGLSGRIPAWKSVSFVPSMYMPPSTGRGLSASQRRGFGTS